LAGLFDLAEELGGAPLLEVLAGRVAVEDLLSLGIKFDFRLGLKRAVRLLLASGPTPGARSTVIGVFLHLAILGV
jgi:hypothetical protein